MPKVVPYEDRNFAQKKSIYSSLAQCISDLKYDRSGRHQWNLAIDKLDGVTIKLLDDENFSLTYYRVETGTVETLARGSNEGLAFLKEIEKDLKKRFKKLTGKTLDLKKVKEDHNLEKISRLSGETSWMLGSSKYGYGARPVGRFAVRDTIVYAFDPELLV